MCSGECHQQNKNLYGHFGNKHVGEGEAGECQTERGQGMIHGVQQKSKQTFSSLFTVATSGFHPIFQLSFAISDYCF